MFRLKFKLIEQRPIGVVRDKWREICRKAWFLVGDYWFRNMLKNHFTPQAKYTYKHEPRSKKYLDQKRKLAARGKAILGGIVDNVLTGAVMRAVTTNAMIRGFPTRVRVSMYGPDYLKSTGFSRRKLRQVSRQPNKKRELITTTDAEQKILKRIMREFITQQITKIRQPKTTTI